MNDVAQVVPIYEVVKSTRPAAQWIQNLLAPVFDAIKAEGRPFELRPTGCYGGWAAGSVDRNPDGRISLSTKATLWSAIGLIAVCVHELSHCLLHDEVLFEGNRPHSFSPHNGAFYCLNLTLLKRLDSVQMLSQKDGEWAQKMDSYDLQDGFPLAPLKDEPLHVWMPVMIGFAMRTSEELYSSSMTAKELAVVISDRYFKFVEAEMSAPARRAALKAAANQKAAKEAAEKVELKDSLQLFRWLTCLFGGAFLTIFYLGLTR